MTEQQVIAKLLARIGKEHQGKYAKSIGVSQSFLSEVLRGSRPPTGKILQALGFERVVSYRRVK